MRESYDTHHTRWADPFTAYLDLIALEGGAKGTWGDATEGPGLVLWLEGRHFLFYSPEGFVEHVKADKSYDLEDGGDMAAFVKSTWPGVFDWEEAQERDQFA